MNKIFHSLLLTISLGMLGYWASVQERNEAESAKLDERLAQNFPVPLDCPPLGQQKVTILADSASTEIRQENMVMVVKQWPAIWPSIYQALQNQTISDEQKADLSRQPEITMALPVTYLGVNAKWSVHYTCPAGSYQVDLAGFAATSATINK